MTTSIPLGFHVFSISFACAASTHNVVTTCAGKNNLYLTAAAINTEWRAALFGTAGRPFVAANLSVNYTITQTKVLANIGGVVQVDVNTTTTPGLGSTPVPPMNTALLVNKPTGFAGRAYRGRMFSPPLVSETDVFPNAGINTSALAVIQAFWTSAYNDIKVTRGIDPVLLHEDSLGLVPTAVSSFTVGPRLGTIGRRLRR